MSQDIFNELPDNDRPVTRGQMRQIVRDVRSDLRWAVGVTIVANQSLNHITLPTLAGYVGGILVFGLGAIKLLVARA